MFQRILWWRRVKILNPARPERVEGVEQSRLLSFICILCLLVGVSATARDRVSEDRLRAYLKPVTFTADGLVSFFSLVNHSYPEFLSVCPVHLLDFLGHGAQTKDQVGYCTVVFKLFTQKMKECAWMNPYALLSALDRIMEIVEPLCTNADKSLEVSIERVLRKALSDEFALLKKNPDVFLRQTSSKIVVLIRDHADSGSLAELRLRITQFVDAALSRIIWNPEEKLDVWNLTKTIAERVYALYSCGVISASDANLLLWTLLYRFGYFIECTGSRLPSTFYEAIRDDVVNNRCAPWIVVEEFDPRLKTKSQYLLDLATQGVAKMHAASAGILSESLIIPDLSRRA